MIDPFEDITLVCSANADVVLQRSESTRDGSRGCQNTIALRCMTISQRPTPPMHASTIATERVTRRTSMRADGNAELGGEQENSKALVDAGDATAVELANINRLGLHQLLEDYPGRRASWPRGDRRRQYGLTGCARARPSQRRCQEAEGLRGSWRDLLFVSPRLRAGQDECA